MKVLTKILNRRPSSSLLRPLTRTWQGHDGQQGSNYSHHNHHGGKHWRRFSFQVVAVTTTIVHAVDVCRTTTVATVGSSSRTVFSSSSSTKMTQAEPTNSKNRNLQKGEKDGKDGDMDNSSVFDLSDKLKSYGKSTDEFVGRLISGNGPNDEQNDSSSSSGSKQKIDDEEDMDNEDVSSDRDDDITASSNHRFFDSIKSIIDDAIKAGKNIEKTIDAIIEEKTATRASRSETTERMPPTTTTIATPTPEESYQDGVKSLLRFITKIPSNESVDDIIAQTRDSMSVNAGDVSDKTASAREILDVAIRAGKMLESRLSTFFGPDGPPALSLTSLIYYLEAEDEVKNPSWKRRKHWFFPGIDIAMMDDLYKQMVLAKLGYAETVEEIRQTLARDYNSELVYATVESQPNKPSHFIAVPKDQSSWNPYLEVTIVVCGTKSISDVLSDLLCDAGEYRGGLAHTGIMESGKWLVEKHTPLLERLLSITNKRKIKLTLVGHSLGAGTAAVAAVEWNDRKDIQVQCTGFGCPALLSEDLCKKAEKYITTVVADADCVPRMSLATMVNALMDVAELNWTKYATRDFEETVDEMERFLPSLVNESFKKDILQKFERMLPDESSFNKSEKKRMSPVLFPPGRVIHFYHDGYGVTGSVVSPTFFDELEITRRMLDDHFMKQGYEQIFLTMMRQYHGDNMYSFQEKAKLKNS